MKLSSIGYKKSSLILGGLFLLSFVSLTLTEKSIAPPSILILLSSVLLSAGLRLSEHHNKFLQLLLLFCCVAAMMYAYFSHPEFN